MTKYVVLFIFQTCFIKTTHHHIDLRQLCYQVWKGPCEQPDLQYKDLRYGSTHGY
jgi:hypothetical protein